jgi:hypothetical protein
MQASTQALGLKWESISKVFMCLCYQKKTKMFYQMVFRLCRVACIVLVSSNMVVAQAHENNVLPLKYSHRDGTYLYFLDRALSPTTPFNGIASVRISRNTGRGFKELLVAARPLTLKEFKKVCGEQTWSQIKVIKKLSSDEEAWNYIIDHHLLDDYGTLAFDMAFRQAMGSAYLDKEAAGLATGKQWRYKVDWLNASGGIIQSAEGTITGGAKLFTIGHVSKSRSFANDSLVNVQWYTLETQGTNRIVMADIFRQTGGKGPFTKLSAKLFANRKGDSLIFNYRENVIPHALYRYYLRPTDELGNSAEPSDTINVISFNFAALPLLQDVSAQDTLNGVHLKWKPLGDLPHVTGIEIQRSRDVRGNYVILDTIAITSISFFDDRVLPDIPYFYRLRLIALKGMEKEVGYSGYVTAVVKNKLKNPDSPYSLEGNIVNGKVHLTWQAVHDPDLYAYFVYRSPSDQQKFEVISPGLQTLEFTDTSSVSGRVQYVYAIKAVNNYSLESEYSNLVTMRQSVVDLPDAPRGLNAYLDHGKVVLSWPSASRTDHAIAGYNIYKRELQAQDTFNANQPAAVQATSLKFILLNDALITQPNFEDRQLVPAATYEYAIASVDIFGIESTYSPFAKLTVEIAGRIVETCTIRKTGTGIELTWDPSLREGADVVSIYRKRAGTANYQRVASLTAGQTTFVDKTAAKGALYIYVISAERGKTVLAKSEEKNIHY